MSDEPTDAAASGTSSDAGAAPEHAGEDAQQPPDGEGFGGPNWGADRIGPAGGDPQAVDRDPDDDAGMVSG